MFNTIYNYRTDCGSIVVPAELGGLIWTAYL